MKSFLTLLAVGSALASPSAFAFKKVQFDVVVNLDLCPLKDDGKSCQEIDGGPGLVTQTFTAEADPSDGNNEGSLFYSLFDGEEFQLKRIFGADYDLVMDVEFMHSFSNAKDIDMSVTLHDAAAEKDSNLPNSETEGSITVSDLAQIKDFTVSGPARLQTMPVAPNLLLKPRVRISNVKMLE